MGVVKLPKVFGEGKSQKPRPLFDVGKGPETGDVLVIGCGTYAATFVSYILQHSSQLSIMRNILAAIHWVSEFPEVDWIKKYLQPYKLNIADKLLFKLAFWKSTKENPPIVVDNLTEQPSGLKQNPATFRKYVGTAKVKQEDTVNALSLLGKNIQVIIAGSLGGASAINIISTTVFLLRKTLGKGLDTLICISNIPIETVENKIIFKAFFAILTRVKHIFDLIILVPDQGSIKISKEEENRHLPTLANKSWLAALIPVATMYAKSRDPKSKGIGDIVNHLTHGNKNSHKMAIAHLFIRRIYTYKEKVDETSVRNAINNIYREAFERVQSPNAVYIAGGNGYEENFSKAYNSLGSTYRDSQIHIIAPMAMPYVWLIALEPVESTPEAIRKVYELPEDFSSLDIISEEIRRQAEQEYLEFYKETLQAHLDSIAKEYDAKNMKELFERKFE